MRYSIGDISRVLGITTVALRYYESEGIIHPLKEENGRRYYRDEDVYRLISAKKYQAMGTSLKEIVQQFGADGVVGMNGEQILARMREKKEEAIALSKRYAEIAHGVDRLIQLGDRGIKSRNRIRICHIEEMLALQAEDGALIPQDKEGQRLVNEWMNAMPFVSVSILAKRPDENVSYALMMPMSYAEKMGIKTEGKYLYRVKGGMALNAVVSCDEAHHVNREHVFDTILQFAEKHSFEQQESLYGNTLFVDCSSGKREVYYDTYMVYEID